MGKETENSGYGNRSDHGKCVEDALYRKWDSTRKRGKDMEAIKVLVVDDNKRIVTILKEALERESDMEVVGTASDGEEALHKISTLRPDVVLLDLIMPKVDGLGVMERMKRELLLCRRNL